MRLGRQVDFLPFVYRPDGGQCAAHDRQEGVIALREGRETELAPLSRLLPAGFTRKLRRQLRCRLGRGRLHSNAKASGLVLADADGSQGPVPEDNVFVGALGAGHVERLRDAGRRLRRLLGRLRGRLGRVLLAGRHSRSSSCSVLVPL